MTREARGIGTEPEREAARLSPPRKYRGTLRPLAALQSVPFVEMGAEELEMVFDDIEASL